jgi:transposase
VNVSKHKVLLRWRGGDVISAIDKQPVDVEHLDLRQVDLDGDEQADTRPTPGGGQVHGGLHAAVYAFPAEHFPRISELIGGVVGPGFMGENVTTRGVDEDDACIGEVWRWGDALLQISAPRGPCYKLGIRMGKQALRTAMSRPGLVGGSRPWKRGWSMPREKSPGKPTTRRYTELEKDQAVRLVRQLREELGTDHGTVQRVAIQLGHGVESVRTWVRERDVVDGVAGPEALRVHELEARHRELEQELRETRRANEILRKAAAYFAQAELDRSQR